MARSPIICPRCDDGTIEVTCPDCDGRGRVPPSGNGPYSDHEMPECLECDGRGQKSTECPACEGKGYLEDSLYLGWTIDFEYGYYIAIGPNYEPGGEPDEDGQPTGSPLDERVEARDLVGLLSEIDAFIEEQNLTLKRC